MTYEILDKINGPLDIKHLSIKELGTLCSEIRDYMVNCCAVNPGHLASSLGAVELIVAMHYVFNTPDDKIVFDVGHQAYAHKILTGRREAFKRNRKKDGLSGFPRMEESPYDAFGAGHSSTSISAALGLAEASRILGRQQKIIALIGDGAMTGGLALEGLNNAGASKADLLVILNDNDQSIDRNIGGVHNYLLKITTDPTYNKIKSSIWNRLGDTKMRHTIQKLTRNTKTNIVDSSTGMLFEALGFRYFGPVDGNDIGQVVSTLTRLRDMHGPRLLHVHTVKGKGFAPAEADPTTWHAPGRFDPVTGEREHKEYPAARYQDVFGKVLCELAREDSRVIGITPAMATGSGMTAFAKEFPNRFFDVGIEEEHAVTFSAGLAAGGMRPYCNIYSSFAQRAYDQIIHDAALQSLPIVLCLDRAGLVGEDGATHNGCFDMASLRCIPNVTICAPSDEPSLRHMMHTALHHEGGPMVIRYPRGCGEGHEWMDIQPQDLPEGKGVMVREGSGVAVLALGPQVWRAVEAASRLESEGYSTPYIYDMRWLKPLDTSIIDEAASRCGTIITLEEGTICGGLYGAVAEYVSSRGYKVCLKGAGIPDRFIGQDSQGGQRAECGLDAGSILAILREVSSKK